MIFWACAALIVAYLLVERTILQRNRKAVPLRIHIYGTRGKTGLTRQVIELLRQNGIKALGRTTGDAPLIHAPDGETLAQKRLGPPNIREYLNCLSRARKSGCQALVMECMALSPENVYAAGKILQPGLVLLTNTRPDHYESQGPDDDDIVRTLSLSMSAGSQVYALADAGTAILRKRAENSGNNLVLLEEADLSPGQENARLANCLAGQLELAPLPAPEPDWPEFRSIRADTGETWCFLDLFSANDVLSSKRLLNRALSRLPLERRNLPLAALLAARADRPLRTRAFADWLALETLFTLCCPAGSHALYAAQRLRAGGACILPGFHAATRPEKLLRAVAKSVGQTGGRADFLLVGLGNSHGYGERFRTYIAERTG
ncbi:MAG: Mur ligase family protein [Desulfovibrionaceae bacterium]|nr:Mur ligase family protein [Desulfovibrionaceae bacterium]